MTVSAVVSGQIFNLFYGRSSYLSVHGGFFLSCTRSCVRYARTGPCRISSTYQLIVRGDEKKPSFEASRHVASETLRLKKNLSKKKKKKRKGKKWKSADDTNKVGYMTPIVMSPLRVLVSARLDLSAIGIVTGSRWVLSSLGLSLH
jgi:hypothetical protein